MLDRFILLFSGSQIAHGEWHPKREPDHAVTKHTPPTRKEFQDHLEGKVGLGIIPVNVEGLCQFGTIDIDIDTINHNLLYQEVTKHHFPLTVCRSKSGGAHLYLFAPTPGLTATVTQNLLRQWATALGYPRAEIFPKQRRSTPENIGNWINLPYFGGNTTTRYAVGPAGALSLEEFLGAVQFYDDKARVEIRAEGPDQLPPCLLSLQREGVTAGYRNQALLNYATFYRKAHPNDWEAKTSLQNSQYFSPPLDPKEVQGVLQSAGRHKYQYTCDAEPLRSFCNRPVCEKLPFGVGHLPWQESAAHDDLTITNCRKLLSTPPKYIVNVNGLDLQLSWEQFYNFQKFKSQVGEMLNFVIAPRKQASWEQTLRELLLGRTDIEAPDDASIMGLITEKLHEFLVLRERATEREDLLRGLPIQDGDSVLFRASDFKRYLQGFKLDKVEQSDLFLSIRTQGATHKRLRLNGRMTMVWSYPLKHVNEQTEDFKIADFAKDLEEEV